MVDIKDLVVNPQIVTASDWFLTGRSTTDEAFRSNQSFMSPARASFISIGLTQDQAILPGATWTTHNNADVYTRADLGGETDSGDLTFLSRPWSPGVYLVSLRLGLLPSTASWYELDVSLDFYSDTSDTPPTKVYLGHVNNDAVATSKVKCFQFTELVNFDLSNPANLVALTSFSIVTSPSMTVSITMYAQEKYTELTMTRIA